MLFQIGISFEKSPIGKYFWIYRHTCIINIFILSRTVAYTGITFVWLEIIQKDNHFGDNQLYFSVWIKISWYFKEKTFNVDPACNKQNDRVVMFENDISEHRKVSTAKHLASIMLFGVVASNEEGEGTSSFVWTGLQANICCLQGNFREADHLHGSRRSLTIQITFYNRTGTGTHGKGWSGT